MLKSLSNIIPYLIFFEILFIILLENVLMLYGEIRFWSLLGPRRLHLIPKKDFTVWILCSF